MRCLGSVGQDSLVSSPRDVEAPCPHGLGAPPKDRAALPDQHRFADYLMAGRDRFQWPIEVHDWLSSCAATWFPFRPRVRNGPSVRDESRGRICARQGFGLACQCAASRARGAGGEGRDECRALRPPGAWSTEDKRQSPQPQRRNAVRRLRRDRGTRRQAPAAPAPNSAWLRKSRARAIAREADRAGVALHPWRDREVYW